MCFFLRPGIFVFQIMVIFWVSILNFKGVMKRTAKDLDLELMGDIMAMSKQLQTL